MLEVVVSQFHSKGYVIDWYGFWKEAMKHGWNPRSTVTKILSSIGEVLGPKVREGMGQTLKFLYEFEMTQRSGDETRMRELLLQQRRDDLRRQRNRLIKKLKTRVRSSDG